MGARASLLFLALAATGCLSALSQPRIPLSRGAPPWGLNRELLTPSTREIVLVIDLVAGHVPETRALDALTRLASRYGERPARWVIARTPAAPRTLRADTSYVFVSYVGARIPHFGLTHAERRFGRPIWFIEINQELHRTFKWLLPEWRLEEQTLIHEYGHALGLPSPDHQFEFGGAHCVRPDCALTLPWPRAILYGALHTFILGEYLEDYCEECRRAIAEAKAAWRARAAERGRSEVVDAAEVGGRARGDLHDAGARESEERAAIAGREDASGVGVARGVEVGVARSCER